MDVGNSNNLKESNHKSRVFPLYEIERGQYRLNIDFQKLKPIKEYIKLQGRFRHLTDDMIGEIEKRVHKEYETLKERAKKGV